MDQYFKELIKEFWLMLFITIYINLKIIEKLLLNMEK